MLSLDINMIHACCLQLLVELTGEFVDKVLAVSCQLAKHRGSDTLELKDVQFHLGSSIHEYS